MKLTTKQLKQIIKEELDLLQLPLEWASIKKEWESLADFKFPQTPAWEEFIDRGRMTYTAKDKEQTIKKYPQYFPPKKSRGWVSGRQASMQVQAHGYPAQNEEGEWGYWDDTKVKPFEWTEEGVFNIWVRDQLDVFQSQINKIKKFYQQKIRPFQSALVHQLRNEMETGFDLFDRVVEDLVRIVNDFVEMQPPVRRLWRNVWHRDYVNLRNSTTPSWYSNYVDSTVSIIHIQNQVRQLKFAFKDTRDLIESWKKRIDREKTR